MYGEVERGKARVDPALLAMVTVLQAALDVPDHEAVDLTLDRRWQMVLDHWDDEHAPFSQGTVFNFRQRLIQHNMDRVLLERTVELARELGGFSASRLKMAFDASPLLGAGRVEDTFNLIGRAAWKVIESAAKQLGRRPADLAEEAGISTVAASSIKAALDRDWDQPNARNDAITELLKQVRALEKWLRAQLDSAIDETPLKEQWEMLEALISQDTEPDPDRPGHRIRRGVAKNRQVSVGDPDMRHGRKSKSSLFNGYKRHVATDLESGAICAVAVTPGNAPERVAAGALLDDLDQQPGVLEELFTDRGYLTAAAVEARRQAGVVHICKPFPLRNRGRFTRADFRVDLSAETITCPNGVVQSCQPGKVTRFPAKACDSCPQRESCTSAQSGRGRSVSIHRRKRSSSRAENDSSPQKVDSYSASESQSNMAWPASSERKPRRLATRACARTYSTSAGTAPSTTCTWRIALSGLLDWSAL